MALDMNTAFDLEVRQHCPNARVVYDLFQIIAKYAREGISRMRVDAANALRDDKPARRVVKRAHWLLLPNPKSRSGREQIRLDEVLAAGTDIEIVPVVIAERGVLEAAGPAACMVEDGDMRLNAALMDEPGKISRIAIAGIGS